MAEFFQRLATAREALIEDLRHVVPGDAAEAADVAAIGDLLIAHPDFPTSGCEAGHVTGSALVVDVERGTLVLHRHRKLNRWFQFGGHADFELDMLSVAQREAAEEGGMIAAISRRTGRSSLLP